MSENLPLGFGDLRVTELRRSAIEDFAVQVDAKEGKESVIAALVEAGITWSDYVAHHPELAPVVTEVVEEPVARPAVPAGVITAKAIEDAEDIAAPRVHVQQQPVYAANDKLLVKMDRQNVRFDIRGHSFTQEKPYALMSPEDATYVFTSETGFRQAYPHELQEFYS